MASVSFVAALDAADPERLLDEVRPRRGATHPLELAYVGRCLLLPAR